MLIRPYTNSDLNEMILIWNKVIASGVTYPQEEYLDLETSAEWFSIQTYVAVSFDEVTSVVTGLYILYPNNIGIRWRKSPFCLSESICEEETMLSSCA